MPSADRRESLPAPGSPPVVVPRECWYSPAMRGLWLEDRKLRLREDLPDPVPAEGEAVVRVVRAGICNTDLERCRGYYPFTGILGHEFTGIVESVDTSGKAIESDLAGQRVVGEINAACGTCDTCVSGRRNHCPHRTVLGIVGRDGAFADRLTLPVENLHAVPDAISDDVATFVEPVAAAFRIAEQVDLDHLDGALVVGDGKLGLLVAQALGAAIGSERVTVAGRHDAKLAIVAERGHPVTPSGDVGDDTFDLTVDCTGSPVGFEVARRAVRPRGTLVLKSTYAGTLEVDASALVVDEIRCIGSRCGPFDVALDALASGEIDPTPLVHARYPLDRALEAMEHAQAPGVLKVLIDVGPAGEDDGGGEA